MHKAFFSFFVLFFYSLFLSAQLHDNIWLTGVNTSWQLNHTESRIDFSTFPPNVNAEPERLIDMRSCGTTICDPEGNLLFYTNCYQILNRENELMENGDSMNISFPSYSNFPGLSFGSRDVQGSVAVPAPWAAEEYVFLNVTTGTLNSYPYSTGTHLLYSIIDMSGDDGLGEVAEKNEIIIEDEIQFNGLTAVKHANGRDWWVLVFKSLTSEYYKVLISDEGISVEGIGEMNTTYAPKMGSNAFSPDGTKYCVIPNQFPDNNYFFEVYDFNRCNGDLSNRIRIYYDEVVAASPLDFLASSVSFSPNSRFLYVNTFREIYQLDLENDQNLISEVASYDGYTFINFFYSFFYYSMLGPDGRIYLSSSQPIPSMHVIEQPNNSGLACKIVQNGLELAGVNNHHIPNHPNYRLGPLEGSSCDTLDIEKETYILAHPYPFEACVGGEAHFEVTAFGTGRSYQWQASEDGGDIWEDLNGDIHFSNTNTEYLLLHDIPLSFEGRMFRCIVDGNISVDTSRTALLTLIGELPTAAFEYQQDKDSLFFENLTEGEQYVTWNFADGDSSTLENPTHLFQADGTFPVMQVATNACGQDTAIQEITIAPLWADFIADRNFGCAPLTVNFTDISPYRVKNRSFFSYDNQGNPIGFSLPFKTYVDTGTYDVRLFVYGPTEFADTIKEDYITILEGTNPIADIELTQNGNTLNLNAPFNLADEYTWYFANGDSLSGQMVEYDIETPGIYEVQLATTNHCGTEVGSIEVLFGELEAAFSASANVGCAPFAVQFMNETAFANAEFTWHLPGGEPSVSDEMNPEVIYTEPGVYDATLIVWADSLADTLLLQNFIEVLPDDCPLPGLTAVADGLTVSAWTSCPDDLDYTWQMGNGDELFTSAITYEYPESGTYEITTIIEGICGADTLTAEVEVDGPSAIANPTNARQVHLAPNPAGGFVMVIASGNSFKEAAFELFNPLGVQVLQSKKTNWGQQQRIDLEGLESGIYLWRFHSEDGLAQVGRLVIE